MTPLTKYLYWFTSVIMPGLWFTVTVFAGAVTWYHGYAIYFIYLMLTLTFTAILWVLFGKATKGISLLTFMFSIIFILSFIAFNVYGLIVLFFPQYNGWNGWNADGEWAHVYFRLPPDFNYATLFVF